MAKYLVSLTLTRRFAPPSPEEGRGTHSSNFWYLNDNPGGRLFFSERQIVREEREHLQFEALFDAIRMIAFVCLERMRHPKTR
jgi:hypothetical protein